MNSCHEYSHSDEYESDGVEVEAIDSDMEVSEPDSESCLADLDSDGEDSNSDMSIDPIQQSLYENSEMTVEEAVTNVLDMLITHKFSKTALKDQLKLINSMLPSGHKMPKSLYQFFKYVENKAPPCNTIKHFFCKNCEVYISEQGNVCTYCEEINMSYFYEIDIIDQLVRLFEVDRCDDKLMNISFNEEIINDICDGSEYRRVNHQRQKYDLTLVLYTDGISLIKSSTSHCWPLMFVVAELPPDIRYKNIIIAGIWYEKTIKPPMNLFLMPFCQKILNNKTIYWKSSSTNEVNCSTISAPLFIADAPARAQIQNILNFNGEYGCNICELKTIALENIDGKKLVRTYPYKKELKLRNQNEMEKQAENVEQNEKATHCMGVKGRTIVSCLPMIDVSTCFVPEFMHSVLLGVTKQFLNVWLNKKGDWRVIKKIKQIDNFLLNIKPVKAVGRMPRSLKSFRMFKATELFNWLIYYSLPTLENNMPEIYIQHWMLLVISIYNLVQQKIVISKHLKEAEILLDHFVKEIPLLYGDRELSYNMHQLQHLCLAVRRWGPLWATSAFPFEDKNGLIAKSVHGTRYLNTEIINNVKIAQGASALKKRLDSMTSTPAELVQVLGKHKPFCPNSFQLDTLESMALDTNKSFFYDRAKFKNTIFTSTMYKETKSNNYTIKLKCNNFDEYVIINCFIQNNNTFYLFVQKMDLVVTTNFVHNTLKSKVKHIIPFKETNTYSVIKFEDIQSIHPVMQVGNYLCNIVKTFNTIF